MTTPARLVERAQQIADQVLFPNALAADAAGVVPKAQLQCLADAGFYGISTNSDAATIAKVIEAFASGCLTTTFVWAQHLGVAAAAHGNDGPLHAELGEALASGHKRGGVAFAHMLRPGTPMTTAEPCDGGWLLRGSAPWVTGWGHIDIVRAAARHGDDMVWAMIDAVDGPTLVSHPVSFAAVDSTQTRLVEYRDHFVPHVRIDRIEKYDDWRARYALGLRPNGSFALGVASRCCRLLEDAAMLRRLDQIRHELDSTNPADVATMSIARAQASLFAVTAATALVAKVGGNAVMMSEDAQRLMRESMFVLVQGQNPAIKSAMLERLG